MSIKNNIGRTLFVLTFFNLACYAKDESKSTPGKPISSVTQTVPPGANATSVASGGTTSGFVIDSIFENFEIEDELGRALLKQCSQYCPKELINDSKALFVKGEELKKTLLIEFKRDFKKEFTDIEIAYLGQFANTQVIKKLNKYRNRIKNDPLISKKVSELK